MAGYVDFSKSVNAVEAEKNGKMTASSLAKYAGTRWKRLKGLKAADIKDVVPTNEWHHSSKMYNRVEYYDPEKLTEPGIRGKLYRLLKERKSLSKKSIVIENCSIKWLEWGGTRKYPKATEYTDVGTVVVKTNVKSVTVHTKNNGVFKKFLGTRGFSVILPNGKELYSNSSH